MNSRIPSTAGLRVLIALAERGSTVAAADAVNLSQSAVSKQLAKLEGAVGQKLFVRHPSGLQLSEAGEVYVEHAKIALKALEDAALRVARLSSDPDVLRLHTLPILGDRWLLPRFARFAERHPHVDVQFTSFETPGQAEPDAAFRYGAPPWRGQQADYLFGRDVALVGAAEYIDRAGGLDTLADIGRFTLLEHPQTPNCWKNLRDSLELPEDAPEPRHYVRFGFYTLVIRAAIAGQGLALIPRELIVQELAAGELVNPRGLGFQSPNCYWFTRPADRPPRRALNLFHDWLMEEIDRD
ncbi:DNA-binding transcriptional LysR family regulator [Pseudorhizobium tarimense]|uniref:DNA-binding transcriptional LysR family regulator n=1 Tax=Pseudorhizobium tarimense TaxID=1079109 RepID=A0ABV2HDZ3_9HYPH|nr:LysR substrate-binding domain-containing protein [Pseudorhizobium tarimense]MCJ8521720.1 LysR substrate-binding domain-containing protein [Pseudorhizobium tarimense]